MEMAQPSVVEFSIMPKLLYDFAYAIKMTGREEEPVIITATETGLEYIVVSAEHIIMARGKLSKNDLSGYKINKEFEFKIKPETLYGFASNVDDKNTPIAVKISDVVTAIDASLGDRGWEGAVYMKHGTYSQVSNAPEPDLGDARPKYPSDLPFTSYVAFTRIDELKKWYDGEIRRKDMINAVFYVLDKSFGAIISNQHKEGETTIPVKHSQYYTKKDEVVVGTNSASGLTAITVCDVGRIKAMLMTLPKDTSAILSLGIHCPIRSHVNIGKDVNSFVEGLLAPIIVDDGEKIYVADWVKKEPLNVAGTTRALPPSTPQVGGVSFDGRLPKHIFEQMMEYAGYVSEEFHIKVNPDGLMLSHHDEDNVTLVQINVPKSDFMLYNFNRPMLVNLKAKDVITALGTFPKKDEELDVSIDEHAKPDIGAHFGVMKLKVADKAVQIPLLETVEAGFSPLPKKIPDAMAKNVRVVIGREAMLELLKNYKKMRSALRRSAYRVILYIKDGNLGLYFLDSDMVKLMEYAMPIIPDKNAKAYTIVGVQYLDCITDFQVKYAHSLDLYLGTNNLVVITMKFNQNSTASYYIAPVIEEGEAVGEEWTEEKMKVEVETKAKEEIKYEPPKPAPAPVAPQPRVPTPQPIPTEVEDDRKRRGIDLFKSGAVEKRRDEYWVKGTRGTYYTVKDGKCECPDNAQRHRKCKHIYAVEAFIADEMAKKPIQPTEVKVGTMKEVVEGEWKVEKTPEMRVCETFHNIRTTHPEMPPFDVYNTLRKWIVMNLDKSPDDADRMAQPVVIKAYGKLPISPYLEEKPKPEIKLSARTDAVIAGIMSKLDKKITVVEKATEQAKTEEAVEMPETTRKAFEPIRKTEAPPIPISDIMRASRLIKLPNGEPKKEMLKPTKMEQKFSISQEQYQKEKGMSFFEKAEIHLQLLPTEVLDELEYRRRRFLEIEEKNPELVKRFRDQIMTRDDIVNYYDTTYGKGPVTKGAT